MYFPSMKSSVARLFLAAYTLLHSKSILVTAGLCELNSDICSATTGTYTDHDSNSREWWAFIPQGSLACREEGCPLYIWIDGTNQDPYQEKPDQLYMLEMLKRRFIAVNVAYDASTFDYTSVCPGFKAKSEAIFGGGNSVVSQLCDGPNPIANCDLGIATHGWSQGAHLAVLGGNYESRVSASLLFGNGNDNSYTLGNLPCLDSGNLLLPRERRRSIVGGSDNYFGGNVDGVLQQQRETSGYDCGDNLQCFIKLPDGCSYASGEQLCQEYNTFFSLSCAACDIKPPNPCPSNPGLITNMCPTTVRDTYLIGTPLLPEGCSYGSGEQLCQEYNTYFSLSCAACDITPESPCPSNPGLITNMCPTTDPMIPANAGYFVIAGAEHDFFQNFEVNSDFMNPGTIWGLSQNLDWLATTARRTALGLSLGGPTNAPTQSPTKSPVPLTSSPTHVPTKSPIVSPTVTSSPTSSPTSAPTSSPTSAPTSSPTASPTASPTVTSTPATTQAKYICSKNEPSPIKICTDGSPAGGNCSTENESNACGNGGKVCWWNTSCPASNTNTTPSPTPLVITPSPTPPTGGGCPVCPGTGQPCCETCYNSGKPSNRCRAEEV